MIVSNRMRELREKQGYTQVSVAGVLGITKRQYYLYESGKREIPIHHLIALADYYDVSLDYLVGLTEKPFRKKNQNE